MNIAEKEHQDDLEATNQYIKEALEEKEKELVELKAWNKSLSKVITLLLQSWEN